MHPAHRAGYGASLSAQPWRPSGRLRRWRERRIMLAAGDTPVASFIDVVGAGYVELALELGSPRGPDRHDGRLPSTRNTSGMSSVTI